MRVSVCVCVCVCGIVCVCVCVSERERERERESSCVDSDICTEGHWVSSDTCSCPADC